MKYTLLELTQDVLSSMDGEEINSIADSVEALQVVKVIKSVYDDIVSRADLRKSKSLFTLTASTDADKPVLMYKPDTVDFIEWIKYNKVLTGDTDPVWTPMSSLSLDEFMEMTQTLRPSEDNVDTMEHTVNGFTFTFHFRNDVGPQWYTTFDDNTIIFDAYDAAVDTTLQDSKTLCYGELTNTFVETDGWVPNLQPQQFSLLLNEAKSLAWNELKQMPHPKAETTARKNWVHLQTSRRNIPKYPNHSEPNFGRK